MNQRERVGSDFYSSDTTAQFQHSSLYYGSQGMGLKGSSMNDETEQPNLMDSRLNKVEIMLQQLLFNQSTAHNNTSPTYAGNAINEPFVTNPNGNQTLEQNNTFLGPGGRPNSGSSLISALSSSNFYQPSETENLKREVEKLKVELDNQKKMTGIHEEGGSTTSDREKKKRKRKIKKLWK